MSAENCPDCPAEKICPGWGLYEASSDASLRPQDCAAGYVCLSGAIHQSNLDDVTVKLCPQGSYCPGSSRDVSEGVENVCPLNYYNNMLGQTVCVTCEKGFSCQETGMVTPDACPAGSYCPKFDLSSGIANVINCPAGKYSSDKYLYEAD